MQVAMGAFLHGTKRRGLIWKRVVMVKCLFQGSCLSSMICPLIFVIFRSLKMCYALVRLTEDILANSQLYWISVVIKGYFYDNSHMDNSYANNIEQSRKARSVWGLKNAEPPNRHSPRVFKGQLKSLAQIAAAKIATGNMHQRRGVFNFPIEKTTRCVIICCCQILL